MVAAFLALVSVIPVEAQHQPSHASPRIPQSLLERPTIVRPGVGAVHDAVDTTSVEAQQFYDQGVTYLHSYVWIEAARSFHQALRADPGLAVAHAGLSVAYVELSKPEEARAAFASAQRLVSGRSPHDRRHVEIRALQAAAEGAPADASRLAAYRTAARLPNIEVIGIDSHIGSQITSIDPFMAALDKLLELLDTLHAEGIVLKHIDLGGGLGIRYADEEPPSREALFRAVFERLDRHPRGASLGLVFEFGRSIVGNAGVLLTRVEYLKSNAGRRFAIVDAAMNDLMRPALYDAWHDVLPVEARDAGPAQVYDIVGPVCESGDWLARGRRLAIAEGDLLAIASAGAYGMAMSSNYNTRPRAAEVIVDGRDAHLVRARESID